MSVLTHAERRQVRAIVEDRLQQSKSAIAATPERIEQLRAQITAVLDDIDTQLGRLPVNPTPELSCEIGVSRAVSQTPPVESLHAAQVLFEACLAVVVPAHPEHAMAITVNLHRSIMDRVALAAASYVNLMLQKVQSAEYAERKRLARELHDRAAHGVGVALQSLDLFELDARTRPERATERLHVARQSMHDAIDSIRTIATELRDTLGHRSLSEAIESYLARFAPRALHSSVRVSGDIARLPSPVAEQLYLVLREAVHNALLHADAKAIEVWIAVSSTDATAEVGDDGIGFDVSRTEGTGLASMRERIELLGGTLVLSSVTGRGTGVRAVVPLPEERP